MKKHLIFVVSATLISQVAFAAGSKSEPAQSISLPTLQMPEVDDFSDDDIAGIETMIEEVGALTPTPYCSDRVLGHGKGKTVYLKKIIKGIYLLPITPTVIHLDWIMNSSSLKS